MPLSEQELASLELLEKMGLGLHFSPGDPFIGQLRLRLKRAHGLTDAHKLHRPYATVAGAEDKSEPLRATEVDAATATWAEGAGEFIFYALFSNTEFEIKLKAGVGVKKLSVGSVSRGCGLGCR